MINRAKMPRQLRNKGGITNIIPREKYGIGSSIKKRLRKIIPNELADVAVAAAPFVAPFNPAIAGIMRGVGRFDQRGSISDALKQGFGTYAGGQLFRTIGGAGAQEGLGGFRFSSPLDESGTAAVRNLFDPQKKSTFDDKILTEVTKETSTGKTRGIGAIEKLRQQIPIINKLDPIVGQQLIVGGATSAASLVYDKFANDFREHDPETESYEEYLAQRKETVGRQMRQYFDNYFKFDKEYSALDDAGKDAFVARYNLKKGGRIGYQTGGITMANTLAENIARNKANQAAISKVFQAARDKIAKTKDYAVPVVQGARALLTGAGEPIITDTMRQDLIKRAEAKGGDSGVLGYEDYGLTPAGNVSGGRFGGGITDIISDPQAFANAATLGRVTFSRDPETGEYSFGDTKYDFNIADTDTGLAANLLRGINVGGLKTAIPNVTKDLVQGAKDLFKPTEAAAAETTPTPDAGTDRPTMADVAGPSRETIIQRILKEIEPGFKEGSGVAAAYPDQYKTGLNLDYLKTLDPDEIKLRLDNAYLQGEGFENPDFSRGRIGGGRPFFRYGPEYMKDFNMAGGPLQLSDQYTGYNLRNELGQLESILGKETIKPYQTKVEDALIDLYRNRYSGDSDLQQRIFGLASGGMPTGIMRSNQAGVMERDYRDKGGFVPVGIKEKADDVPAMLSKNEFVMTANAVRGAGNGSIEKGAQRMYDTMKRLEKRAR